MRRLIFAAAVCVFAGAAAEDGEDGETLFRRFLAESPSAKLIFRQTSFDADGREISELRGRFWYRRPGLFRVEYDPPEELVVVSDGEQNWTHQPDLNQVIVQPADSLSGASALLDVMASGDLAPLEGKYLFFSGLGGDLRWFNAEARETGQAIRRFRLAFSPEGVLRRMELRDSFDNTAKLEIYSVSRKEFAEGDSLFRFTPPVGADILRE